MGCVGGWPGVFREGQIPFQRKVQEKQKHTMPPSGRKQTNFLPNVQSSFVFASENQMNSLTEWNLGFANYTLVKIFMS